MHCLTQNAEVQTQVKSTVEATIIGRVLIAWFNDCILGKSGQIANPRIAMVNPVPYMYMYYSIPASVCLRIY